MCQSAFERLQQRRAEDLHAGEQALVRLIGVVDADIVPPAVLERVEHIARNEDQAHVVGPVDEPLAVHPVWQAAPDVHAAARSLIGHAEGSHLVELLAHKPLLAAVAGAELIERLIVGAVVEIAAQQLLRHPVRRHQAHGDQIAQAADDVGVRRDDRDAQARDKGQREGIDVNDDGVITGLF